MYQNNGWLDVWMDIRKNMDGSKNGCLDEQGEKMDGWIGEIMDGLI